MDPALIVETEITNIYSEVSEKIKEKVKSILQFNPANELDVLTCIQNLINGAYKEISKDPFFSSLEKQDYVEILDSNIELILEWINNPDNTNFTTSNIVITNYDLEEQNIAFLNGLFHYIQDHKYENTCIGFKNIITKINENTNQIKDHISDQVSMIGKQNVDISSELCNIKEMLDAKFNNFETLLHPTLTQNNDIHVKQLEKIQKFINAKDYKNALVSLDLIKESIIESGSPAAKENLYEDYFLVYLKSQNGTDDLIQEMCDKLIENTQDPEKKEYRLALKYYLQDKLTDSLTIVEKHINKSFSLFSELKAILLYSLNRYNELLDFSINNDFDDKNYWVIIAQYYLGNEFEALKLVDERHSKDPNSYEINYLRLTLRSDYLLKNKSLFYSQNGYSDFLEDTLKDIDSFLLSVKDDYQGHEDILLEKLLLNLYSNKITYNDIESYINELDLLHCKKESFLQQKGLFLLATQQYNKAIAIYDQLLLSDPNNVDYKNNRTIAFSSMNPSKFREECTSIPVIEENIPILLNVANSYMVEFKYNSAIDYVNNLNSLFPNNSKILETLATTYCFNNDLDKGFTYYNSTFLLDKDPSILAKLIEISIFLNDKNKMQNCVSLIQQVDENQFLLLYPKQYINLYIAQQDFVTALSLCQKCKSMNNYSSVINYLEILCLFNQKRYSDVLNNYIDNDEGIDREADINQKRKIFIFSARNTNSNLDKAKVLLNEIDLPENEYECSEIIKIGKRLMNNTYQLTSLCANAYKKNPLSKQITINFINNCSDKSLYSHDKNIISLLQQAIKYYDSFSSSEKNKEIDDIINNL